MILGYIEIWVYNALAILLNYLTKLCILQSTISSDKQNLNQHTNSDYS